MIDFFSIADKVWKNKPIPGEDLDVLLKWLVSREGKKEFEAYMQNNLTAFNTNLTRDYSDTLQKVLNRIEMSETAKRKVLLNRSFRVAAIFIPLIFAVGIGLHYLSGDSDPGANRISHIINDPILILPNGSRIILDNTTENTLIAEHGNVEISRENGRLINEKQYDNTLESYQLKWGTVEVPYGIQFDMVLEDGTQVWLNAGSRLSFPIAFSENERRVILRGEAYFDVTPDTAKPFIIETSRQYLTVLGTEFNIYAYENSAAEYTTLVKGSVSVTSAINMTNELMLQPGQQAVLSDDGKIKVNEVNANLFSKWRNGVFVLEGNTLGEVFDKLSRWYNFDFSLSDDELSDYIMSGNLRMTDDVNVIFDALESMGHIRINVKDNTIKIKRE